MRLPRLVPGLASAALPILLLQPSVDGQQTTRVSVDSSGAEENDQSDRTAISADGQIVAFSSYASNLVAGDTNGTIDVFVHDRSTGITERVSVDSSGVEGNGSSNLPAISSDGQIVAFQSDASNLVPGDNNGFADVFVRDRSTGITERVSVDSAGAEGFEWSLVPAISADGRIVAFESYATLVAGDTNSCYDIFVHDRSTGITERVSVDSSGAQGNGWSVVPSISADGLIVAFESDAWNLVTPDANLCRDVFVHDRTSGITEFGSVDSSGKQANRESYGAAISADGQTVAFGSIASNLVTGDTNRVRDVFVHDRSTGATERVSVDSSGAEGNAATGTYCKISVSEDGQVVAFSSYASNLVAGDTNGNGDVFVRDRSAAITDRVSVDPSGMEGNNESVAWSISADGQIVAFTSYASNLVPGDANGVTDVFLHDRCATVASWSNFGTGFPGTTGVPAVTSRTNPVLGTTITIDLANSYAQPTIGALFVGFQRTDLHSGWGGDLLVVPAITELITFSWGGDWFSGDIPDDWTLCGFAIDLQAIEADPGAAKGVSFTPGLELVLGH